MPAQPAAVRFARMAGSSVAAPGAAAWTTDFLNAACYARPDADRDPADLRLAYGIINTRWARGTGRRMGARDVAAFNRAFGRLRLRAGGQLNRAALLAGARTLLGDWFGEAWHDPSRRAYGVAFKTVAERRGFAPERRLTRAALGVLTPPRQPASEQHWATYDPVGLPAPDAALALLSEPARWPDIGSLGGRFTPLRSGSLLGQTFEIEVVAQPAPRLPVFTRGYVTCTTMLINDTDSGARALGEAVSALSVRYAAGAGPGARPMLPADAEPLALIILTTNAGHFLGRALSHLLVWRDAGGAWIRDVGAWDRLAPHLAASYAAVGRAAQQRFWGPSPARESMLAQLGLISAGDWDGPGRARARER